ncbi:UPF0182 family protein [Cyanobium sp. NIES-981]|uniref:UPF0182 family protein n=1 Tax=Cyanobium sp. NIES-981 TaxID=1851505 RepID=UPI000B35C1E7|nr:UPF0182 family protein [Cyanobium sp. NIES-981]
MPRGRLLSRPSLLLPGLLVLALALLVLTARLWVEWSWFSQFNLTAVLARRWALQLLGLGIGLAITLALQRWLLWLWALPAAPGALRRPLRTGPYALVLLALLAAALLSLSLIWGVVARLALQPFDPARLHGLIALASLPPGPWLLLLVAAAVVLLARPQGGARWLHGGAGLGLALVLGRGWGLWSLAVMAQPTGLREPLLGADVSFVQLRFPALALALTLAIAILLATLALALWGLMARGSQLSDGHFAGFAPAQLQALRRPLAALALLLALAFWLGRHQLLLSTTGSVPGAGWLDVHLALPLRTAAAVVALLMALLLLLPLARQGHRGPATAVLCLLLLALPLLEAGLSPLLQNLLVNPQELEREMPYLARSIDATRRAFQIDAMEIIDRVPNDRLSRRDLAEGEATLSNVRLWDSEPLLATNRQLQQLRVYYRFSEPAVDRYALQPDAGLGRQQVIMAARELDQGSLPRTARTWLNRHLVFTHGNGFTLSPVNTSGPEGLPEFFISDLGPSTKVQGNAQLGITRQQVEQVVPTRDPFLYFGSLASPYALAPTAVEEFNYPQGDNNFYIHYSGGAGVPLGRFWQRLAAAIYLREPKLLVRGELNASTRLLLHREVRDRVRALAPFVRFEAEPYLISVNLEGEAPFPSDQHQYWIVDGFTSSAFYPYSAAVPGRPDIRYLRNSVKAVVDAFTGQMVLYVAEPADPLIRTWQSLFPELFQPLAAMPVAFQDHIMYPRWQFQIQTTQLLRYHVTDPRIFYSGDDVWQVPKELYGQDQVPVEPYHISAQLPGEVEPEFLLLQPLTPLARPNLVGWLAARSDAPHYGELTLLRFPSQLPIYGPEQVQALINQNPRISQQFGLWDRAGSQVIQGNLLVVPIGQALLYVEPVYLRARAGGLPTLTRVVVSDSSRIAMEPSLREAIDALLDPRRSEEASPQPEAATPAATPAAAL